MRSDVVGQLRDATERLPRFLAAGDLDPELFFERDDELERVDRVEVEPRADQRLIIRELVGREVLELEGGDDEVLEPGFERIGQAAWTRRERAVSLCASLGCETPSH